MSNMAACGAFMIVALAVGVTPALGCAHEEMMTEEEIAAFKNGGQLSGEVVPPQMTPPRLAEPSKADAFDDVIARAGSSLLAQADTTGTPEVPPAPPAPEAAPAAEPAAAAPVRKRVVVSCSGTILSESAVL